MTRWRELGDRIRNRAHEGLLALRLVHQSGVGRAARAVGAARFSARALRLRRGPHLASLFHACNTPDKVALVTSAGELTYGEFDSAINRLARALSELGVTPGDRVALMLPNCAEHVIAQLAILRLGATIVEIGYRLKRKEVSYILGHSEPQVVIYDQLYADVVSAAQNDNGIDDGQLIVVGDSGPGHRYRDFVAFFRDTPVLGRSTDGGGGVLLYTSGTTGTPKGADRNFGALSYLPAIDVMLQVGLRHDDRQLVVCPLYHSAAPALCFMLIVLGGTNVVLDHFDETEVLATIERYRLTGAFMVPTMLARIAALPRAIRDKYDCSSLRWVCSGAAPLPTATARAFQAEFGDILWNFYGATETGMVTLARPEDHAQRPGTVGRPLAGNVIRIVDSDGEVLPTGEVGEIYIKNGMLFQGYHRNPDATREKALDGFFSVGDLGRLDEDGYLYLESRVHDMVISGGVNIYPREIENHLLEHPDIVDVAVVGVPDERWGESLAAFVVKRPGADLDESQVIDHCRLELADYKRPRQVRFIEEIPRNPTGKILKRALRDL